MQKADVIVQLFQPSFYSGQKMIKQQGSIFIGTSKSLISWHSVMIRQKMAAGHHVLLLMLESRGMTVADAAREVYRFYESEPGYENLRIRPLPFDSIESLNFH